MMLGQRADEESIDIIKRDLGLDRPVGQQFVGYLNDLSPISIHNNTDEDSYWYLSDEKYEPYGTLFSVGKTSVVVKMPYLRRSYQTKRRVTENCNCLSSDSCVGFDGYDYCLGDWYPVGSIVCIIQGQLDRPYHPLFLYIRDVVTVVLRGYTNCLVLCIFAFRMDSLEYVWQSL